MSSAEFSDWVEFYSIHPFGSERDNLHAAMIASIISNVNRGKSSKVSAVDDFMIMTQSQRKDNDTQLFINALAALAKKKES